MASDGEMIKRLAREVADELQNRGYMTTLAEARAIDKAESNLICKRCSTPVAAGDDLCNRCGARQAVDADEARFRCVDCNMPISDPNVTRCPACRGTKVTRADPSFKYECIRCGTGVSIEQSSCPSCGETRAVPRPVRDVIS